MYNRVCCVRMTDDTKNKVKTHLVLSIIYATLDSRHDGRSEGKQAGGQETCVGSGLEKHDRYVYTCENGYYIHTCIHAYMHIMHTMCER